MYSTKVEKQDKVLKPYFLSITLVAIFSREAKKPYYLIGFQVFYALPSIEPWLLIFHRQLLRIK